MFLDHGGPVTDKESNKIRGEVMKKTVKKLTPILGVLMLGLLMIHVSQAEEDVNVTDTNIKAGIKTGIKEPPDFKVKKQLWTFIKPGIVVKPDGLAMFDTYDLSSVIAEETDKHVVICAEVDVGPVCASAQCVLAETGEPTGRSGQCCWSVDQECQVINDTCVCTETASEMTCTGC